MGQNWDVIIVGGGMGGLACAQFLRQAGLATLVLERSAGLSEVGAGLQLAPNALAALREINLLDELLSLGCKLSRVELRSTRSGLLSTMETGADTLLAIHRAQLQKALAKNLETDSLRFGVQIQGITQDEDQVELSLASGESLSSRLLIGADGLRSQVRSLLFPAVTFRYSGTSSYRGVVEAPDLIQDPPLGVEIWGPACRVGCSPISAQSIYWYLTFDAPPQEQRDPAACRTHALQLMEHFPEQRPIIERTETDHIIHTDISDIKPNRNWIKGRVALVGDAAHATTPNLGQGAAQAIEDAWALALAVKKFGLDPLALAAYEAVRQDKALWIVKQSWSFQSICHLKKTWQQSLRDFAVKHVPASFQKATLDRIYKPEVGLKL
jgi:2-polyprenyl-6-methoxyphenol hydroxylase-like FAD-dependent oxidoreductase